MVSYRYTSGPRVPRPGKKPKRDMPSNVKRSASQIKKRRFKAAFIRDTLASDIRKGQKPKSEAERKKQVIRAQELYQEYRAIKKGWVHGLVTLYNDGESIIVYKGYHPPKGSRQFSSWLFQQQRPFLHLKHK